MDRRWFLRMGVAGAVGAATLPTVSAAAQSARPGQSPYGAIDGRKPDENGVILPEGFTARVVAVAGEPVGPSGYPWRLYPDGAATFDDGGGGWYYVCNSEVFESMKPASGGVSAIHFGSDGSLLDAYSILDGSHSNSAGGPTPWGTWLSCEEGRREQGLVWECDPTGTVPAAAHPAMGLWAHEAVAVDPVGERLYLTQDHPTGVLYRYTPTTYPDLSVGLLEAATVSNNGTVTWSEVPDPSGQTAPTRTQVAGATVFPGAEGIWYHADWIYFTTKVDNRVHAIDVRSQRYRLIWSADRDEVNDGSAVLSGVDNITVDAGSGDLYVAEDGGNMEIVIITPDGQVAPFLRVVDQPTSEITGPAFNPARDRLYFSSQRGPTPKAVGQIVDGLSMTQFTGGITFEVTGPFRGIEVTPSETPEATETAAAAPGPSPTPTSTVPATPTPIETLAAAAPGDGDDGTGGAGTAVGVGVAAAAVVAAGAVALRRRRPPPVTD